MGRPPITLTEMQKAEIETLAAVLSVQQIADYFGIARSTFFTMITRDSEIARNYHRGKARAIGSIAQSLITKARNGDTASMIFYLKTQAGWRETPADNAGKDLRIMVVSRNANGDLCEERMSQSQDPEWSDHQNEPVVIEFDPRT